MDLDRTVNLFVPCLVDQVLPSIGVASTNLLERLGYRVNYEPGTVCCGQPAFNSGCREQAREIAIKLIECMSGSDVVVCPSGSCTSMIRCFYPELFRNSAEEKLAQALSPRVFELTEFICKSDLLGKIKVSFEGNVSVHQSCHSERELKIPNYSRQILESIEGVRLLEETSEFPCCGFGGVFYSSFPEISSCIGRSKLESLRVSEADLIISNDPGCVMQFSNEAKKFESSPEVLHIAEFLSRYLEEVG